MNNQFSENLKRIRKENNLSQEQLADELGVSRQAISKWESAVAYPEMDKIIALCEKFNVNIDFWRVFTPVKIPQIINIIPHKLR